MTEFKHTHWGRQINNVAHELSRLAIVCDIELGKPGLAERILKNDESVCGRKDPEVFRQIRQHLGALFSLEVGAVKSVGLEDTREMLDQIRAAIVGLRQTGSSSHSLPKSML